MVKFSARVKSHILQKSFEELGFNEKERVKWKDCCSRAFLRAALIFLARREEEAVVYAGRGHSLAEIVTFLLLRGGYAEPVVIPSARSDRFTLTLSKNEHERILCETACFPEDGCDRCRVLYLRAAFLSCATVLDPSKGYHAAFLSKDPRGTAELVGLLEDFDVYPSLSRQNGGDLIYFKDSRKIEDLLSLVGAQSFALDLMNQKIEKSIRADINRRQNFDDANIKKTVNGAQTVIEAIHYIETTVGLESLSEPLQKAAMLRMAFPEVSLSELCQRSEDEITKSGLNHRLQKIVRLYETMKREEFEVEE